MMTIHPAYDQGSPSQHSLSMTPKAALAVAEEIAINLEQGHIDAARDVLEASWQRHLKSLQPLSSSEILQLPIAETGLPLRTVNELERTLGVLRLEQLLHVKPERLYAVANLGEKTVRQILDVARQWVDRYQAAHAAEQLALLEGKR